MNSRSGCTGIFCFLQAADLTICKQTRTVPEFSVGHPCLAADGFQTENSPGEMEGKLGMVVVEMPPWGRCLPGDVRGHLHLLSRPRGELWGVQRNASESCRAGPSSVKVQERGLQHKEPGLNPPPPSDITSVPVHPRPRTPPDSSPISPSPQC